MYSDYSRSYIGSEQEPGDVEKEDDAEFFSVANEYNERRAKMIGHRAMEAMNMYHNYTIKNNPKELKGGDVKEEKTRKTRNDKEGRQYICGKCLSGYLSYPALYTHIKTKHDGISPEGTIRGKNNNNKRRGRPKTLRKQPNLYHRDEPESQFPTEYENIVPKLELTFLDQDQEEDEDDYGAKAIIQSNIFKAEIKGIYDLSKRNDSKAAPISTLPILKIMAIFLHNMQQILEKKTAVMMTVENIMVKLVSFINNSYAKILKEFQESSNYYIRMNIPSKFTYCAYEKCDYIPVFVDKFLKTLDIEEDQLEIDFLNDFCRWLSEKKLTYIKLLKPEIFEVGENEEEDDE